MITFDASRHLFHIRGKHMSYIMAVGTDQQLHHVYWGRALEQVPGFLYDRAPYRRAQLVENQDADSPKCSREFFHYECPTYGMGDFRLPAVHIIDGNGIAVSDLRYAGYEILSGRKPIPGLPCAHGDTETLIIRLSDAVTGVQAELYYHLFSDCDVLTRHTALINRGKNPVRIDQIMSATVDFENGAFDLYTLDGTTLREFTPNIRPLAPGITEIGSMRGISSHQHHPAAALLRKGTDQTQGEVYGFSMIYSGSFTMRADLDQYGSCRFQAGIQPFSFSWKLDTGERFDAPEAALAWSEQGLNGLSASLHPFVQNHILTGPWADRTRPVLLNTWEACYFDVSDSRLREIGGKAAQNGIELLVLDDGWFGRRNQANCSLGDWRVNPEKFPHGLEALSDALPMKLGLWFEPEMISPDSDLYRAHPDWCLHAEGRVRTEWRNQLVLDLSRDDVVNYLINALDAILSTGKIAYIKWDHNRRLTQAASAMLPVDRQGEIFHRYTLGFYRLVDHVHSTYPDILMENCASGGGRFDYGTLCYFQQGWLSDNTDPVSRLEMQNAASVFFPPVVITSHISASPNHQIGRETPYAFREAVCALFNAGYELDILHMNADELNALRASSAVFADNLQRIYNGRFIRLNPSLLPQEWFGWMHADEAGACVAFFRAYCKPEAAYWTIPLTGLKPDALYRERGSGEILSGADWMASGIRPAWREGDYFSQIIYLDIV